MSPPSPPQKGGEGGGGEPSLDSDECWLVCIRCVHIIHRHMYRLYVCLHALCFLFVSLDFPLHPHLPYRPPYLITLSPSSLFLRLATSLSIYRSVQLFLDPLSWVANKAFERFLQSFKTGFINGRETTNCSFNYSIFPRDLDELYIVFMVCVNPNPLAKNLVNVLVRHLSGLFANFSFVAGGFDFLSC